MIFDQTCLAYNFLNIDPILAKPVPMESPVRELSIGAGLSQIGAILRKLWTKQIGVSLKFKKKCVQKIKNGVIYNLVK